MGMKNSIIKYALANSLLTAFYVVLVATFLNNAQSIFGPDEPKTALIPMAMLLLLVLSATICGTLVFGRPLMWYLDGKKREALSLLGYTVLCLFVVLIVLFIVLYAVVK